MNKFPHIVIGSLFVLGSHTALSYPYYHCEGNGAKVKLQSNDIKFTINESQFTNDEVDRLKDAVRSWGKTRIGETQLNVDPDASEVIDVTVANGICEGVASLTGTPPGSPLYESTLDLCLEEAFEGLTDYSIIWRTGFIDGELLVHAPPINFAPVGWVFFQVETPPGYTGSLTATAECLEPDPQGSELFPGIDEGQPYLLKGRNVQLARPQIAGIYGHPGAGIGSVNQALFYDDFTRSTPRDINLIAVHEIGHVLGLVHPSTGSITQSVMRPNYEEIANYNGNSFLGRVALPEPIDAKNISNLYPATTGSLIATGTNQWEWTSSFLTDFKTRPQSSYTSYNFVDGTFTGEIESWPYDQFQTFAVPISLYNKGTTNKWTAGFARFLSTSFISPAAPSQNFGAQLPPRSSVTLLRWLEKPSPFNNANPGEYRIQTFLTTQPPNPITPLDSIHLDTSALRFNFD